MTDFKKIAVEADAVVKTVESVEPMIAGVVGMFVPGAAGVVATVQPWAPLALSFLDRALNDISTANGGDVMSAFIELLQHVSKGQPSSSVLTTTNGNGAVVLSNTTPLHGGPHP